MAKKNQDLTEKLLQAWEETYKKGQLTLWIFLALRDGKKFVSEIKVFIEESTEYTIQAEEQSLYRALRKHQHLNMVAFESGPGKGGPDRKYYYLSPLGQELLKRFIDRNIKLFFKPSIQKLMA